MYTIVELGLTPGQIQDLQSGVAIHLAPNQFSGTVPVPLTKAQTARLASAKRGFTLKLSGPQRNHMQGGDLKGLLKDVGKALLPIARKGVDKGLDYLADKIPTHKLGDFQEVGDAGVNVGRKYTDKLMDRVFKKIGGHAGAAKVVKQMGQGWFDDVLKGVTVAADIATPFLLRGRGWAEVHPAIDKKMGQGWFDNLLKGVSTVAQIATPFLLRGGSFNGYGWFDDVLKGVSTAAQIATPFLQRGRGWKPVTAKKNSSFGQGLVLH